VKCKPGITAEALRSEDAGWRIRKYRRGAIRHEAQVWHWKPCECKQLTHGQ